MSIIVLSSQKFRPEAAVYYWTFLLVVGNALFPVWLYQGLERMKYITALTLGPKILATAAIFLLVHREQDYVVAAAIQGVGGFLAGAVGLVAVNNLVPVKALALPSLEDMRTTLREGWSVFVSSFGVTLFGNSNIFILGLFASLDTVGHFAVADKVVRATIGLTVPINTAVYPRVSVLFAKSIGGAINFLRRVLLLGGLAFFALSLALFLGASLIAKLVTGQTNPEITSLIRLMAIIPFTVFVDNVFGVQPLLNLGMTRQLMKAILSAGAFSVVASFLTVPRFGAPASAVVFTLSQVVVLFLMVIPVHQRGIRLLGRTE
jgi:PST family polysaccharide transporter